jgi:HEAT repeat protein
MRTFAEMRVALMALAVPPLLLTSPAMAEPSAAELLEALESKDASVRMLADVALTNLASGISWANAQVKSREQ